jgi:hypothetical protein
MNHSPQAQSSPAACRKLEHTPAELYAEVAAVLAEGKALARADPFGRGWVVLAAPK